MRVFQRASPAILKGQKTRQRAYALRMEGATYQAIGGALGISRQAAWQLVISELRAVRETNIETVEDMRMLENFRLDMMHAAIWPKAIEGDLLAIDRVLKIMVRRAKLLGLDAPRRVVTAFSAGGERYATLTDEERAEKITEIIDAARARQILTELSSLANAAEDKGQGVQPQPHEGRETP